MRLIVRVDSDKGFSSATVPADDILTDADRQYAREFAGALASEIGSLGRCAKAFGLFKKREADEQEITRRLLDVKM